MFLPQSKNTTLLILWLLYIWIEVIKNLVSWFWPKVDCMGCNLIAYGSGEEVGKINTMSISFEVPHIPILVAHYVPKMIETNGGIYYPYRTSNKILKGVSTTFHNATTHQFTDLLKPCIRTRHFMLTNTSTQNNKPRDNTIPTWILKLHM